MVLVGCFQTQSRDPYGLVDKTHSAITPAGRLSCPAFLPRHQQILERVAQGNIDMIFVGDSITHAWETRGKTVWDQYYAPRNAVNMGLSGDRTQDVLWRLDNDNGEIDGISPKLAVLLIGTNNSRDQNTAEEIADGIKAICAKLRTKLPKTKILMLAIFPRGDVGQRENKECNAVLNPQWAKNNEASKLASKIADSKHIFYLDINEAFLDKNGVLSRDIMPDLLHPNEKGYKIWAEAMEPTIKKLMDER
jgi:beta-glucosidase